jgi:MFS transporter, PHS family, inorganic phosphate transporter
MTEYANRRSRGKQLAMMFSAYTLGQIGAFIVALTLLATGMNHDLAWRLMLALGALPALAVLYNRRRMPECSATRPRGNPGPRSDSQHAGKRS